MGYIFRLSFANLKLRKLRTVLTIVGIMIGIMSIITMLTAGMGAKKTMMEEVEKSGSSREIRIDTTSTSRRDMLLTDAVVTKLEKLDGVHGVYPVIEASGQEKMGSFIGFNSIVGISEEYMQELELEAGTLPVANGSRPKLLAGKGFKECLYNEKTWTQYSETVKGEASLVDKRLDFALYDYTASSDEGTASETDAEQSPDTVKLSIVGETKNEYDYNIYTDLDTLKMFLKRSSDDGKMPGQPLDKNGKAYAYWCYSYILVRTDSVDDVEHVSKVIKDMGYQVSNNLEAIEGVDRIVSIVQLILGAIGSIAGIVAVIGIINTMMTAVYDRIREIGLLKMLGAAGDDISFMFLFESAVLGFFGGLLGIGLSYVANLIINNKLVEMMKMPEGTWIMDTPVWLLALALVMSVIISMMAGAFPARWASKIKPLDAIAR